MGNSPSSKTNAGVLAKRRYVTEWVVHKSFSIDLLMLILAMVKFIE
jgi:hypothetical protein